MNGSRVLGLLRGLGGAAIGGVLGYYGFQWALQQGFYAIILPGTLLGLGFGLLSRQQSKCFGALCAVLAVALGVFVEWRFFPFVDEDGAIRGFNFFLSHLHERQPITLLLIGAGGLVAFWFGMGRDPASAHRQPPAEEPITPES